MKVQAPDAPPAKVRRDRMLAVVRDREYVRVSDLSEMFGISGVTVRGDLDTLSRRGLVRRFRGGAVAVTREPERPFEETTVAFAEEKARIGHLAAALVESNETVILDVGTTTMEVARALVARTDLSEVVVFTNGLNIALELERAIPRFTVVVTGGTLRPLQHSLVDPLGGVLLGEISADTVFLGCNGLHLDKGVTNLNLPEAQTKRIMLEAARRRVIVADGSKVGRVCLAHICDVDEIDLLITDGSADEEFLAALPERGVEVRLASRAPDQSGDGS